MIAAVALTLFALQNAAPVSTPLGRPVVREANPVLLMQRSPATRFEVAAVWTLQEKLDMTEVPSTEGRKFVGSAVQYDTLIVKRTDIAAALADISRLETPVEMQLPRDGRLMLVWDAATGVINAQMAASAVVVAEGEALDCPRVGEREVNFTSRREQTGKAVLEGNRVRIITPTVREGDPTPRLTAYPTLRPLSLEEVLDQPSPQPQVSLGFFELLATGERIDDVPMYRCSLSTWQDQPGPRELCVAQSADGLRWYLWFDGAMPE